MPPVRLLLVDDHALFREGLIALLSYQDDFTVVGEAEDAESALDQARALEPDIVLMDIELPGEDGVIATQKGLTGKPAPDTFLYAAELLGVGAAGSAVFEDALAGVESGRAGHFGSVVGVDRVGQAVALREHGADVVVQDLAELLDPS